MASFDSSIPPRTHCSAARSCGGVRSKSPSGEAISVTLTRSPPPTDRPTPVARTRTNSVVVGGYDSLVPPRRDVQCRCAQPCGHSVQTRRLPCAQAEDRHGDMALRCGPATVATCLYAVHGLCAEKISAVSPSTPAAKLSTVAGPVLAAARPRLGYRKQRFAEPPAEPECTGREAL